MNMAFVYKLLVSKTNHAIKNGINGAFHVKSIKNMVKLTSSIFNKFEVLVYDYEPMFPNVKPIRPSQPETEVIRV